MDTIFTIAPILAVLAIGVISPGPSFIQVARTSVAYSRSSGIAAAIGMAMGAMLLSIAALFGLHALLEKVPSAYFILKVLGGLYLIYLAIKTWRCAPTHLNVDSADVERKTSSVRHFLLAVGTMLSNPKAAVQYGVIFAAMLPITPTRDMTVALPLAVFALEASWYLLVAFILSAPGPRNSYLSFKTHIDRTVGAVLSLLGMRLIISNN